MSRHTDGSAGDANYGLIGSTYVDYRQPDPRIANLILSALGSAEQVLNIGAGAGSYEPIDRSVTPVEPSVSMREQRSARLAPAIDAVAEALPFPDKHFDAAMATFTIHQWQDLDLGLSEMARVTKGPLIILTCDPALVHDFWLNEYVPQVLATEARRYPALARVEHVLGRTMENIPVPIPLDCKDGFNEAYYGRPEMFLDPGARLAMSAWSFVDSGVVDSGIARLGQDLDDGTWDMRHGYLRQQPQYEGALRLLVAQP